MSRVSRTLSVPEGVAGERIDSALTRVLGLSRTAVVRLLEDGDITTSGKAMAKSDKVTAGQIIEVLMPEEKNPEPIPLTPIPGLSIIYNDESIVVIDKPVGCAAHPSPGWEGPTVVGALTEKFGYKTVMRVPKLQKIVLSQGIGDAVADKKLVDNAVVELSRIAGQRAISTISKKDISNFKLRKGMPVGTKVTLRGDKMFDFLDRLISVALPRTRDFRGINPKGFDGRGNFNLGIKEHIIFPEIDIDKVSRMMGMDITFVTSAENDEEAKALLDAFGFPFIKK